jgi:hypothetical protein
MVDSGTVDIFYKGIEQLFVAAPLGWMGISCTDELIERDLQAGRPRRELHAAFMMIGVLLVVAVAFTSLRYLVEFWWRAPAYGFSLSSLYAALMYAFGICINDMCRRLRNLPPLPPTLNRVPRPRRPRPPRRNLLSRIARRVRRMLCPRTDAPDQ